MKKRTKIITGIIASFILIGGISACNHHRSPEEKADYLVEKISSKLELNEPQIINLEQLKTKLLGSRQELKSQHELVHQEIAIIFSQPTLDQQRIIEIIREQTEIFNNQAPGIVASIANFYDKLTPEQQSELSKKISEHKENKHH